MKFIILRLFFVGVLGVIFLSEACMSEDDSEPYQDEAPEVIINTSVGTSFDTIYYENRQEIALEPLDKVIFDILIKADGGFANYSLYLSRDGAVRDTLIEVTYRDLNFEIPPGNLTDRRTIEIPSDYVGSAVTMELEVYDQLGQSTKKAIDFIVESPKARVQENIRIYAAIGDLSSACFFHTSKWKVLDPVTANSESLLAGIDFGYYFGAVDSATIASPKGFEKSLYAGQVEKWMVKNATVIRSTSITSLEEVERFEDIDLVYEQGVDESGIANHLQEGDVLAFENVKGKRGVMQITEISVSNLDSMQQAVDGYINVDIKMQQRVPREE